MDVFDDALSAMVTAIYIFLFFQFFKVEKRLMKMLKVVNKDAKVNRLFMNNPMLRYKTSNGPITSPLELLSLSTFAQTNYYYTTPGSNYSHLSESRISNGTYRSRGSSHYQELAERQKTMEEVKLNDLREEAAHVIMQVIVQSFVKDRPCESQSQQDKRDALNQKQLSAYRSLSSSQFSN